MERHQSNRHASGFSLIEVALALMVIGILMASAMSLYNVYMVRKNLNDTTLAIENVEIALRRYIARNGFYPLPADRDKAIGQTNYGRAVAAVTTPCSVGVVKACVTASGNVYIGDVPFASLGLRHTNANDPYGNKMTYAVSRKVTLANFLETDGSINVRAENGSLLFTAPTLAHYFVFSPGPNRNGAFGTNGQLVRSCSTSSADSENCNNDDIFRSNFDTDIAHLDTYRQIALNNSSGANQFDDWSAYKNSTQEGMWTQIPSINKLASTNGGNVLVGDLRTCDASCGSNCHPDCINPPRARIEVQGAAKATSFRIQRICYDGPGCNLAVANKAAGTTSPSHFAGAPNLSGTDNATTGGKSGGGIFCPNNRGLRGFEAGDEVCVSSPPINNPNLLNGLTNGCDTIVTGKFAVGVDASGKIVCN